MTRAVWRISLLITLLGALFLSSPIYALDPTWNKSVIDATATTGGASSSVAGDFDGDGDQDLVWISGTYNDSGNHGFALWLNDGLGNFTQQANICGNAFGCWENYLIAGDIDGDLIPDLVTIDTWNDTIAWWRNDGNGNFGSAIAIEVTTALSFGDFILADMDGDTDLDLVTGTWDFNFQTLQFSGETHWWRNDGGAFTARFDIDTSQMNTVLASADLDNDLDQDLIVGDNVTTALMWYRNDGGGVFTRLTIDTNAGALWSIRADDLDGDNDADIVITDFDAGVDPLWWRNDGGGIFSRFTLTGAGGGGDRGNHALNIVDLDADGDKDVLVANDSGIVWARNDGGPSASLFTIVPIDTSFATADATSRTTSVDVADFDGDTDLDIVGTSSADNYSLSNPDGFAWWAQEPPPVVPVIDVTATDAAASETGLDPGVFTFTRTLDPTDPLTVYYTMSGVAQNGADYDTLTGTITFPAGQASTTLTLTPIDDLLDETDTEDVILTLSPDTINNPITYAVGGGSVDTVNIADDDLPPSVSFGSASSSGYDTVTPVAIPLILSEPSGRTIYFSFSTGGTAMEGTGGFTDVDVTPDNSQIVFNPGETTQYINLDVRYHTIEENDETVILSFSGPCQFCEQFYTAGAITSHTYTILDWDSQRVIVNAIDANASEPGADTGTFEINRHAGGATTNSLTVNYSVSGTATSGTDYTALTGTVTIPANQTTVNVTVTPLDDNDVEGPETVVLTLSSDAAYKIDSPSSATVTVADDDVPGITVTPSSGLSTTEAGGTATFDMVLDAIPTDPVSIALSSDNTAEGDVSPAFVTFTAADWNVPQTVTVTGVDDVIDDGDIPYKIVTAPSSSLDGNFDGLDAVDVDVTNTDDDTGGITVNPLSGLIVDETGDTDTFTIVLDTEPTANVTIALTSDTPAEGTVSPPSVTFGAGDWNIPQTVTVTGVDDAVQDGDVLFNAVTAPATSGDAVYNTLDASDVSVTNVDNETPGIKVKPISGLVTREIGTTDTFDVVLYTAPTADVVIPLSSDNTAEGTIPVTDLTFTNADWNIPQTVTITGADELLPDGDVVYHIVTDPATSGDPAYDLMDADDVTVINIDNDTPGITVTPLNGTTTEAGGTFIFNVVLNTQPTADVTIGIGSDNPAEGTIPVTSLTFTNADWDIPQPVTVTGVDDFIDDGNVTYHIVTAPASSTDPDYSTVDTDDVTLSNTDDDVAGITVTPTSGLITTEAGGFATFTVVLDSEPLVNVDIGVASGNSAEGSVSPGTLTFTPADWSTPQTVTVTGVDDNIDDGDILYTVITAAASAIGDALYNGRDPSDVTVTNTDDDTAGITVNPLSGLVTTEAGGTASFTIVLDSEPLFDVTVGLSSSDTNEGTVPASKTFNPANWDTPQTVTVTGVDDSVDDGDIAYNILTGLSSSTDPKYSGIDPGDVGATNTDDDTVGISIVDVGFPPQPPTPVTTEGGGSAGFSMVLDTQPIADVSFNLSSDDASEGTVSPPSLTFTAANWNVGQTITITGVDDFLADGDQVYNVVTATATSGDPKYNNMDPPDQPVTNIDNDSAGIVATPSSGLITDEGGGSANFSVFLSAQPSADVTIPVASSDTTEGDVSTLLLTFTSADWDIPQNVVVTGVDDAIVDGNVSYSVTLDPATSGDSSFNGLDANDVSVVNQDNDTASISVDPVSGLITDEGGGSATFDIVMGTQPLAPVLIQLDSNDPSEGIVSPTSVSFDDTNWNIPQTVTVTGVDDVMVDGDIAYTVITQPATSTDPAYDGFDASDVAVLNSDDDVVGITVNPISGLITSEDGGSVKFAVVLDAPPTSNVSISLSSNDSGEGTVSPGILIFTPANWGTPQKVTVTGVDDTAIDGSVEYKIITAAASSTDARYHGLDPYDVTVTNTDNDIPGFTITPAYGLTTSESGGTASFDVVLDTEISADVGISLTSTDPSEGTVSPSGLTFTSGTWNVPQTVTVTGVDDTAVDGSVPYTILTSIASSADGNYNGIDPSDISLSNSDNDLPPPVDPTAEMGLFWEAVYDSGNFENAADVKVEVDPQGNVYVTGRHNNGVNSDFITLKFDGLGNQLWPATYDGGDSDLPVALRVDGSGNSYVAGMRHNGVDFDYIVVKYDTSGNQVWVSLPFDTGGEDEVVDMAVDGAGNVYLTGNACSAVLVCDIATIKLAAADGGLSWSVVYDNGANTNDVAAAIGLDVADNVFVAGRSRNGSDYDLTTVKYSSAGSQQWLVTYDNAGNNDYPEAMAVDAAGNSYIASRTFVGFASVSDYQLVKYNSAGTLEWAFTQDMGSQDIPVAVAVDSNGSIYLSGSSGSIDNYDFAVMKIKPNGTLDWSTSYDNSGGNDKAAGMVVDGSGRVYVTGSTGIELSANRDFLTVGYDSSGVLGKALLYDLTSFDDVAGAIALGQDVDGLPNVHVAGTSISYDNNDIVVVKYGALLPDLTMSAISAPATGVLEGPVSIDTSVVNEITSTGSNKDAGAFDVGLYLTTLSNLTLTGYEQVGEIFFDDFSDGTLAPWTQYGAGSVTIVDKGGSVGWVLEKDTGADPDGGLAPFSPSTSDFELTLHTRRTAKSSGALWTRIAVTDGAGNGYGIRIESELSTNNANLRLEKRIAYIGNGNEPAAAVAIPGSVPLNAWYTLHLKKEGATLTGEIYSGKVNPSSSTPLVTTSASDSSYNSFSQVVLQGGYAYDVDDVRVVSLDLNKPVYSINDPGALIALGTYNVPAGLAAGDMDVVTTAPSIPAAVTPGDYYVVAVADDADAVRENIESNNNIVTSSAITISDAADLKPASVAVNGASAELAGNNIVLDYTVDNLRTVAAGAFSNSFVLTANSTVGDVDDIALPLVSGGAELGVVGNGSVSGSATVTIPADTPPGSYKIGILVDSGAGVIESDELNNTTVSAASFTVNQIVDLSITVVSAPYGAVPGTAFTVFNTVKAEEMAAGTFDVGIYLSTDPVFDGAGIDTQIGTRQVAGLSAGQQNSDNTLVTIPGGTADGIYYIIAVADDAAAVTEWNENNNSKVTDTTISLSTTLPELVVTNVQGPSSTARGGTISVSTTVKNALPTDAGTHRVGIYLSTDAVITTTDTYLGSRTLTSLTGNSSNTASTQVTIPVQEGATFRRPITITNNGSVLTDQQITITLDTASLIAAGKMRSDGGDIRFHDSDDSTLLNYWVESGLNTSSTKIWIKVPQIPSPSKTIYLHYGNLELTSLSDVENTLVFYDDFESYSEGFDLGSSSKWINNNPADLTLQAKTYNGSRRLYFDTITPLVSTSVSSITFGDGVTPLVIEFDHTTGSGANDFENEYIRTGGSGSLMPINSFWKSHYTGSWVSLRSVSPNTTYAMKNILTGSRAMNYIDGVLEEDVAYSGVASRIRFSSYQGRVEYFYMDNIKAYRYAAVAPIVNVGLEDAVIAPEIYYLGAIVDDQNAVPEVDENNNSGVQSQHLAVTSVLSSNRGTASASGGSSSGGGAFDIMVLLVGLLSLILKGGRYRGRAGSRAC